MLKLFFPAKQLHLKNNTPDGNLGFNLVWWNQEEDIRSSGSIKMVEKLPTFLGDLSNSSKYIYSSQFFPILKDIIIYVEDSYNELLNNYITDNYDWLQEQASKKGCDFVYLPKVLENENFERFIVEYLSYYYPQINSKIEILSGNINLSAITWTKVLLEFLNLPGFKLPAIIRNRSSIFDTSPNEYSCTELNPFSDFKTQFEKYFNNLQPANYTPHVRFTLDDKQRKKGDIEKFPESEDLIDIIPPTTDELFEENANKLSNDVIRKIEYLKKEGKYSLLAEIALRLFDGNEKKLLKHVNSSLALSDNLFSEPGRLQIEWTSKYNFQIILPDYGNLIVEMPRLPKTLYLFFLQHPEGVKLNYLADHKEELLSIYSRISNFSDKNEIEKNISRLTNPLDNSVNVNCSRIKNAFVKLIDDNLAKSYYITGKRGQPKKIALPVQLIQIINNY